MNSLKKNNAYGKAFFLSVLREYHAGEGLIID